MNIKQISELRKDKLIEGGLVECQNCKLKKRYFLIIDLQNFPKNFPKIDLDYIDESAKCCKKPFYMWKDY